MRLEILLEEPSAERALEILLPKMLPGDIEFHLHPHNGKNDLLKQLGAKLRAYSRWLPPDAWVVVMCDQDRADCRKLKQDIEQCAQAAGLSRFLARIAVTELESWFLGDPQAVETAYPRVRARSWQDKAEFRNPDEISDAWETLDRLLVRNGYTGGYQKILGAESIAHNMDVDGNRSRSFQVFRDGLRRITSSN